MPMPTLEELRAFREREIRRNRKQDVAKSGDWTGPAIVKLRNEKGQVTLAMGERINPLADANAVFDDLFFRVVGPGRRIEIGRPLRSLDYGFFPAWLR